ncbi:hypothetical protein Tco_1339580, partial [Tanacetum coccineum]
MTTRAHQIAKENALVAPKNRREIGKCNLRIDPNMKRPKETTYQVVLDALALSTCYQACLITVEVPSSTCINSGTLCTNKVPHIGLISITRSLLLILKFSKIFSVFAPELKRTFAAIINKCFSGKLSGLDKMRLSRIQILWGMFYKKNVDFVALIWEDLAYQIENKNAKKTYKMYYPRFTKAIISHYIKQNPSISLRNKLFMHTTRDDTILGFLKFVSKNEDVQVYGALIPKVMMNQEMLSSKSFQTYYAIATGAAPPKTKKQRKADSSKSFEDSLTRKSPRIKRIAKDEHGTGPVPNGIRVQSRTVYRDSVPFWYGTVLVRNRYGSDLVPGFGSICSSLRIAKVSHPKSKKKAPAKADTGKSLNILSDVALAEDAQLKEALRRSRQDVHISQASGSGSGANEGTDEVDVEKSDNEGNNDDNDDEDNDDDNDSDNNDDEGNDDVDNDENDDEEKEENDDEKMDFFVEETYEEEDDHKLLNLENVNPANYTLTTVIDTSPQQTSSLAITKTPLPPPPLQQATPTPDTTTSQVPVLIDEHLSTRVGYVVQAAFHSYKVEFEKEAQAEQDRFIDIIDKMSTYKAAASLTEFELKKILLDKMHDIESYRGAQEHRDLYECLAKSYKLDKDIFDTYGEGYSLKRDRDDQDKDEDPSAGSDRGKKGGNQEKRQNLLRNQSQKILSLRVRLKAPPNLHASQL